MSYFRFRRSFKILPGVRWNIGKKSSSVSLGGQGCHYTIGPSGTRTTVGLPGTGLSYTSVSRRKRVDRVPDHHIAEAIEWSKAQEETFQLHVPDRTPGELPATSDQIEAIQGLVHSIAGTDLTSLGENQATYLIDEITREKAQFTERKIHEYLDKKRRTSPAGCLFLIVALAAVGYVFLHFYH
jgi:hypothetical protein